MDFILVIFSAITVSALTLFSGFGLGTLLMPVFALFMPLELAVAATAVVHGANNILKAALLGKLADRQLVLRFGIPAVFAAFAGAWLLKILVEMPGAIQYTLTGIEATVTPLKLAMALLMIAFAVFELHPKFEKLEFDRRYLPVGGMLSGFFGGLSGHQGALRSAFLAKTGVSPKAFVGTNALIALMVDAIRITAYGAILFRAEFSSMAHSRQGALVLAGTFAAFSGVVIGKKFLHKVTMKSVQRVTGIMLLVIALLLGSGVI